MVTDKTGRKIRTRTRGKIGDTRERTRARSGRLVNEREWRENRRNLSGLIVFRVREHHCHGNMMLQGYVIYEPHGSVYLRHSTLTLTSVAHLQRGAGDVTHRFPVEGGQSCKTSPSLF